MCITKRRVFHCVFFSSFILSLSPSPSVLLCFAFLSFRRCFCCIFCFVSGALHIDSFILVVVAVVVVVRLFASWWWSSASAVVTAAAAAVAASALHYSLIARMRLMQFRFDDCCVVRYVCIRICCCRCRVAFFAFLILFLRLCLFFPLVTESTIRVVWWTLFAIRIYRAHTYMCALIFLC